MNANHPHRLPRPLQGIVPPLITPLLNRDALDVDGLGRLVEHVLAGGVHGLFVLGTTGEGPSLGYRLRRELTQRVCQQVAGRVPVLVGITDTAFVESVAVAQYAAECGADAVVLAPPYYMPEGQPELREYLSHLLPELRVPLFLYNMPPLTKVSYELETVQWALAQPGVLGLKDSSGNMLYFARVAALLKQRGDWSLLVGPEELLASSLLEGGLGGVPGGANLFPRLYVELYQAGIKGQFDRARELQRVALMIADRLYRVGKHPSAIVKGIKCAASCLGLCSDFMAEPFHRFRAAERQRVEAALDEVRSILAQAGVPA